MAATTDGTNSAVVLCDPRYGRCRCVLARSRAIWARCGDNDAVIHLRTPGSGSGYPRATRCGSSPPQRPQRSTSASYRAGSVITRRFIVEEASDFMTKAGVRSICSEASCPSAVGGTLCPGLRRTEWEDGAARPAAGIDLPLSGSLRGQVLAHSVLAWRAVKLAAQPGASRSHCPRSWAPSNDCRSKRPAKTSGPSRLSS